MEKTVLAAASNIKKKYYFNTDFDKLPYNIKKEIKMIAVNISEKVHGLFVIGFYVNSDVYFEVSAEKNNWDFDEIGGALELKLLQAEKAALFHALSLWYRTYK